MTRFDYGLEKGGSPDPTGYGDEDVRARAEELARKHITDPTELWETVNGLEIDIWPDLALAMHHINEDALGLTLKADMLRIHAMVLAATTKLGMSAARRDLIERRGEDE